MSDIQIIQGDCREFLSSVPRDVAIVADPPYGISACNRSDGGVGSIVSGSKFYGRQKWDLEPANKEVIKTLLGFDRPTVIWGGNYFDVPPSSCWLVWDKMQRDFTFADAELAWTNIGRAVRVFSCSRGELVSEGKVHPTQKPFRLMKWCIELLRLPPKSTIFDPYMGSGTTGVAAIQLGHNFIGCEIDPTHYATAEKRINAELNRHPLFDKPRVAEARTPLFDAIA